MKIIFSVIPIGFTVPLTQKIKIETYKDRDLLI
jgi:hypothetical protein